MEYGGKVRIQINREGDDMLLRIKDKGKGI